MASKVLHVLVIDDSKSVLARIQEILLQAGHEVSIALGPKEGLSTLVSRAPDLILLDIEMPNMNGYQVCSYIRRHHEWDAIPIIFLSGHTAEEAIIEGFAAGGNDYIIKPFNDREMIARVEAHGTKALMEQELASKSKALEDLASRQEAIIIERTSALQKKQELVMETLAILAKERNTQNELVDARKLASLGELVADVAHQINTPLGNSVTLTSFLIARLDALGKLHRCGELSKGNFEEYILSAHDSFSILAENLKRISTLVDRFKNISINQYSEQAVTYTLEQVFDNLRAQFQSRLETDGTRLLVSPYNGADLVGYPAVVSLVLESLVSNALDHGLRDAPHPGTITITTTLIDSQVQIRVVDNGQGIKHGVREKMWEPFFSSRKSEGFLGLGLFVAHNLVTGKLSGTITSNPDFTPGTCFTMQFPQHLT